MRQLLSGAIMTGLYPPPKRNPQPRPRLRPGDGGGSGAAVRGFAQTIRKDLNDLCDQRSLTRIHGGAIIASGVENLAYEARRFVAAEEKKAIGSPPRRRSRTAARCSSTSAPPRRGRKRADLA
jgi:hypothetical protein